MASAIIRVCASVEEALVVRSLLQDAGFHVWIDNQHHATLDWFSVQAFGGVYVRVAKAQLMAAGQYMLDAAGAARVENTEIDIEEPSRRRNFARMTMPIIQMGAILPLVALTAYILGHFIPPVELGPSPCLSPQERIDQSIGGVISLDDDTMWPSQDCRDYMTIARSPRWSPAELLLYSVVSAAFFGFFIIVMTILANIRKRHYKRINQT